MNGKAKEWMSRILPVFVVLLFAGLLADAFSGFEVIRRSGSVFGGIGMLLVLGVLYIFVEEVGSRVAEIDSTEQPLPRRVLNLFVFLVSMVVVATVFYYVFSFFKI